jgi:hypothetical protein
MQVLAAIMRLFPIVISLISVASCQQKSQVEARAECETTTIQLIDTLGRISMNRPNQTDTFITWIRTNDCGKTCEEGKYRFQPKGLPIFKESGFFWTGEPEDSVNQLTISHLRPDRVRRNDDYFAVKRYQLLKEDLESDPETMNIISDTVRKIGDRYFCIFQIADIDKKKGVLIRRVIAFTSISGAKLQFRYDLLTKRRDSLLKNFFSKSISNLETVRMKDGS